MEGTYGRKRDKSATLIAIFIIYSLLINTFTYVIIHVKSQLIPYTLQSCEILPSSSTNFNKHISHLMVVLVEQNEVFCLN